MAMCVPRSLAELVRIGRRVAARAVANAAVWLVGPGAVAVVAVGGVVGVRSAAADPPPLYNRSVPVSSITYEPDGSGIGGWVISAAVALSSNSPQNLDLGSTLLITVQSGTAAPFIGGSGAVGVIVGPGNIPHPPGTPAVCDLFCIQTCQNPCCGVCVPMDTVLCMCIQANSTQPPYGPGYQIHVTVPMLHAGDVITASTAATPGSAPELDTADDVTTVVVTLPACTPATPIRCADGRCVASVAECGAPPCAADFNHDGHLAVADIFAFLNAWFAGDPNADFDGVNGLQVADIFAFLNAWFVGC